MVSFRVASPNMLKVRRSGGKQEELKRKVAKRKGFRLGKNRREKDVSRKNCQAEVSATVGNLCINGVCT